MLGIIVLSVETNAGSDWNLPPVTVMPPLNTSDAEKDEEEERFVYHCELNDIS